MRHDRFRRQKFCGETFNMYICIIVSQDIKIESTVSVIFDGRNGSRRREKIAPTSGSKLSGTDNFAIIYFQYTLFGVPRATAPPRDGCRNKIPRLTIWLGNQCKRDSSRLPTAVRERVKFANAAAGRLTVGQYDNDTLNLINYANDNATALNIASNLSMGR